MKPTALIVTATVVIAVLLAGQPLPATEAQTGTGVAALSKAQWREDVRYFAKELPKRHKNLYHATSREQFERAVADLDAAIPSLEAHQIIVGMQQIAATVGDGHTGVRLPSFFKRYPIGLYWFGRELRVIAAGKDYQSTLGMRVVKIGGLGIDEVQARIRSCFTSAENENEWYVLSTSPAFIVRPEVLHALGIVPDVGRAPFTLEDDQGRQLTVDIGPVDVPPAVGGVVTLGLLPAAKEQPLYRQQPGEPFWFTYLPDSQTTYVSFRRYVSLGDHARELFAFIDRNPTTRLVIDLRQNGGGDFFQGRKHLIAPLKKRPAINQKGRLFVVVGRQTFSAAMVNAIDFRRETHAILVGEPIGERPNSYSENDEMTLPHSRLVVSYSTKYYKFLDHDVPAVLPDTRIDPDWAAFHAGRDPVMDWILGLPALSINRTQAANRAVSGNRIVSREPRLTVDVDGTLKYIGTFDFDIRDAAHGERILFADTDANGNVRRLFVVQFESMLPTHSGSYDFASSNPVRLGPYDFNEVLGRYTFAAAIKAKPGAEAELTRDFLAQRGLHVHAPLVVARYETTTDTQQRSEMVVFYWEDAGISGIDGLAERAKRVFKIGSE